MPSVQQLEFERRDAGHGQEMRILEALRAANGDPVPMPRLALSATPTGIGVPVHSRIAGLRNRGFNVLPAEKHWVNGQCHTYYRLIE